MRPDGAPSGLGCCNAYQVAKHFELAIGDKVFDFARKLGATRLAVQPELTSRSSA